MPTSWNYCAAESSRCSGRILARTLADTIRERGWSEERALEMARLVLLENPRRIFAGHRDLTT